MATTVLRFTNPTLKLAADQASIATGVAYECQVTAAEMQAQPKDNTVPATGCKPETISPGATGFVLAIAWLQDWSAPGGGLSKYAYDNDGQLAYIELTPDSADPTTKLAGELTVRAANFGGTFGDGSAGLSTSTWPFSDKPTITTPAIAATAATAAGK